VLKEVTMLSPTMKQATPSAGSDSRPYVIAKNLCKYYPISGFGHRVVKSVDDVSLTTVFRRAIAARRHRARTSSQSEFPRLR